METKSNPFSIRSFTVQEVHSADALHPSKEYESLMEEFKKQYKQVLEQREEILKAFVAKYGCEPDEIVQVHQWKEGSSRWYVEKKSKSEPVAPYIP